MNLSKVREFIFNEGQPGKGPAHVPQFNYPREYDLVVRVDEITTLEPHLAAKVMTGGHQPTIGTGLSSHASGPAPCKSIKISDSATITFELWAPEQMIPERLRAGDVIRIKSVVASTAPDHKTVLVPTDHSNLLQIHKSFKLYGRFHRKIENTEYDLSTAILGCATTKPPQFVRNSDDGG